MNSSDDSALRELRNNCYRHSHELDILNEKLDFGWSELDSASDVLGVFNHSGRLMSCMSATRVTDINKLAELHPVAWMGFKIKAPLLILRRAATDKEFRGKGFNTLLRKYFFQANLDSDIEFIGGEVITVASRVQTMQSLGYIFFDTSQDGGGIGTKKGQWIFAALNFRTHGELAVKQLDSLTKNLQIDYPLNSEGFTTL